MKKNSYKHHRPVHSARSRVRNKRKTKGNYFFVKANICLGVVLCTLVAVSVENDSISNGCKHLAELIGTNTSSEDIESGRQSLEAFFKGEKTYALATEKSDIILSEEIKAEISRRSGVYEQNNKGAPQTDGYSPVGE